MKLLKKTILMLMICFVATNCLSSCNERIPEESTDTSAITSSSEITISETEEKNINPNNLPVYVDPEVVIPDTCLSDIELGDEEMSELLAVGSYPFRTSYGFGYDSPFTTEYLTSYINSLYGTSYELITVDDINYFNTNHYYISAEKFDGDAVNRLIWFSFYSGNLDCNYDCFMLNRAIMLSLDLVPMVDEIPSSYIYKYVPGASSVTIEQFDFIMDDYLRNGGRGLTEDELLLAEVLKYNISFHDILNWRYNVPMGRRTNGTICMLLTPNSRRYQGVIDGCGSLGVTLNTEQQYYAPTDEEVRVIVKDTPEFFEEIYGVSYEEVLEMYGLPLNPVI